MYRAARNKSDLLSTVTKPVAKSRLLARSTLSLEYQDGSKAIRYQDTDVVTFKDNHVILDSGGWRTVTTKERINTNTDLRVFAEQGIWYVSLVGKFNKRELFYDGITFDTEGNLVSESQTPDLDRIKQVKKQIAKFVKLVDNLEAIPMPEGGDCWGCSMFKTADCLQGHLDEGYLHGSLIVRALEHVGCNNPGLVMHMGIKDTIKRALRRYFKNNLLPELSRV